MGFARDMPAGVGDLYHIATERSEVISHLKSKYIDEKEDHRSSFFFVS